MEKNADIKILTYQDVIFRGEKRRTREEMISEYGEQATEFAEILECLSACASQPRPISTPRRIFISYRYSDEQSNKWVHNLVRELRVLGNYVEFDIDKTFDSNLTIPQFIGTLATCSHFLYVIDPGYMRRLELSSLHGREHGWASNEYRVAKSVGELLRMPLAGFLREGDEIPKGTNIATTTTGGDIFDVRTPEQLQLVLNHFFGNPFHVPEEKANEVSKLIFESEIASEAGDDLLAFELADRAVSLVPDALETQQQLVITSLWLNKLEVAEKAAARMLQLDGTRYVSRYLGALAFVLAGNPVEALNLLWPMYNVLHDNWRVNTVITIAWKKYGLGGNAIDCWNELHKQQPNFIKTITEWAERPEAVSWLDISEFPAQGISYPRVDRHFFNNDNRIARLKEIKENSLIYTHFNIGINMPGASARTTIDQLILSRAAPFLRIINDAAINE